MLSNLLSTSLSSQIMGPTIFSFTYIKSVAVFPPAIYYLSASILLVSFSLLGFVRVPKETIEEVTSDTEEQVASALTARENPETLIDLDSEPDEPEANSGRIPKSSLVDV